MRVKLRKFPYRYLPYEERLSLAEAGRFGPVVSAAKDRIEVRARFGLAESDALISELHRLTYFSHYSIGNGPEIPTQQFLFETTANGSAVAARQSTRYSTHGLHEYKGKFHPQIARYLMTHAGLVEGSLVFDPFAGSGTVLVEAIHFGCNAIGVEANPLAVAVATSKIELLTCTDREIRQFQRIVEDVLRTVDGTGSFAGYTTALSLATESVEYLQAWYSLPILKKLLQFRVRCQQSLTPKWCQVTDVFVSAVARELSQQDPADLRIRRRKQSLDDADVRQILGPLIKTVLTRAIAARNLFGREPGIVQELVGDSRVLAPEIYALARRANRANADAIITSPPYATALPYIDTDRLSLVLLGLCLPSELKRLEKVQIGNREISPTERRRIESQISERLSTLPRPIGVFVNKLRSGLKDGGAGFRKQNMPALLVQYFDDMRTVLRETKAVLAPGGPAFWLVGPNRTEVTGKWLQIPTPQWLGAIAESLGYAAEIAPLDAYQRFGLHQRNGIRQEFLITLRSR